MIMTKREKLRLKKEWKSYSIVSHTSAIMLKHPKKYPNRVIHAKLEAAGMTQSMSRVAKCIDNGPMEGFWGIIKRERYYGKHEMYLQAA